MRPAIAAVESDPVDLKGIRFRLALENRGMNASRPDRRRASGELSTPSAFNAEIGRQRDGQCRRDRLADPQRRGQRAFGMRADAVERFAAAAPSMSDLNRNDRRDRNRAIGYLLRNYSVVQGKCRQVSMSISAVFQFW